MISNVPFLCLVMVEQGILLVRDIRQEICMSDHDGIVPCFNMETRSARECALAAACMLTDLAR